MKAFLMYRDRDFDLDATLPLNTEELAQDLELAMLFSGIGGGDKFLSDVAKHSVFTMLRDPEAILYRQRILADCMEHPDVIRSMYAITVEAIEREKHVWSAIFGKYPEGLLHRSVEVLQILLEQLKKLRRIADEYGASFHSDGFARFFDMVAEDLDDEYLTVVDNNLRTLAFRGGILMSAELGKGNKGAHYVLRTPDQTRQNWKELIRAWKERLLPSKDPSGYVCQIADRDEAGLKALSELRGQGVSHVATALAQSTDHILSFFSVLRVELGFYVGCLNLRDRLAQKKNEPICFPEPLVASNAMLSSRGLYDVCLALSIEGRFVGNDLFADGKLLVMITGANRGGKSTFLRALGVAQIMMQCGMFVAAESFRSNVCSGIYTHFKREEDTSMRSGKLDEELSRMSAIIDTVKPNGIVLLNESFSSTNEREGSEIARQIVRALLEVGVRVYYVTHMFDLAQGFHSSKRNDSLFLRAERLPSGQRTFRLIEAEPLPTSYGEDLYARIFSAMA